MFCSTDGQYVNQGKLGAAILVNHASQDVSCLSPQKLNVWEKQI